MKAQEARRPRLLFVQHEPPASFAPRSETSHGKKEAVSNQLSTFSFHLC
jgi:hypothetical protein